MMRFFTIVMTGIAFVGMAALASANPAMLPKHPGYPSRGEFANDTGQNNLTYSQSVQAAAKSGDTTMGTVPKDPNNAGLLEPQGVGQLPVVQGAKIQIEPSVKENVRVPKN